MLDYDQLRIDGWFQGDIEAKPAEFTTAFRSGTGGHRVTILPDRIVTRLRTGGTSHLPLDQILSLSTFEGGFAEPTFGVLCETRSTLGPIGFRFDDQEMRSAFIGVVRQRLGRGAMVDEGCGAQMPNLDSPHANAHP